MYNITRLNLCNLDRELVFLFLQLVPFSVKFKFLYYAFLSFHFTLAEDQMVLRGVDHIVFRGADGGAVVANRI